jgi:hypothetical protein
MTDVERRLMMNPIRSEEWTRREVLKTGAAAGVGAVAITAGLSELAQAATAAGSQAPAVESGLALCNSKYPLNFAPALSADRERLAFAGGTMERHSLFVGPVFAGLEKPEEIVPATLDDACVIHALCFAHGGSRIAFLRRRIDRATRSGRLSIEEVDLVSGKVREVLRLAEARESEISGDMISTHTTPLAYTKDDSAILFHSSDGLKAVDVASGETWSVMPKLGKSVGLHTTAEGLVEYLRDPARSQSWEYVAVDPAKTMAATLSSTVQLKAVSCIQYAEVAFSQDLLAFTVGEVPEKHQIVLYDLASGSAAGLPSFALGKYYRPATFYDPELLVMEEITSDPKTGPTAQIVTWPV